MRAGTPVFHPEHPAPQMPRVLRVCRAENCRLKGSEGLLEHVETRLAIKLGQTTADGGLTLSDIYCLGNCSNSPSVMLDGKIHGHMTPQAIDALLDGSLVLGRS